MSRASRSLLVAAGVAGVLAFVPVTAATAGMQYVVSGSATAEGAVPGEGAEGGTVSDDGRYVAFDSRSDDLPGANGHSQVYVRDLQTDDVVLASPSIAHEGTGGNDNAINARISGDGRYVVYRSSADDLVTYFESTGAAQIYVRDLENGVTIAVSHDPAWPGLGVREGAYDSLAISRDGSRVAFLTKANLIGVHIYAAQAYVADMATGHFTLVSRDERGDPVDRDVFRVALSPDGTQLAFTTATNRVASGAPGTGGHVQAYARDISDLTSIGDSRMVSINTENHAVSSDVHSVAIADTGAVAFVAPDVTISGAPSSDQVLYRTAGGLTAIVSHDRSDAAMALSLGTVAGDVSISANGSTVAYSADSERLITDGPSGHLQVYRWNAGTSTNVLISTGDAGAPGDNDSWGPRLSCDGSVLAFDSTATDLVSGFNDTVKTGAVYVLE